ncbi:MAG: hypothetical protein WCG87_01715 [Bacteroidota bacterium]
MGMKWKDKAGRIFLAAMLIMALPEMVLAQTNTEVYGQNRIQYRKFKWKFFDTQHFRIYHYDAAGIELARYVSEQAEKDISVIEKKMGGQFPHRFNIILYNSYDEFRQTNVGRKSSTTTEDSPAGTIDLVGDKLIVYYTGEHIDLKRQLRSGMSRVVMQRMIFGESFREMVKNAVLLNLPQWVTDGYIAYLVDGWDTKSNTDWKNILVARPKTGFYELSEKYPELAGKAFWKFVATQYGENTTKNLLYTMQLKSNLNNGIKMTMGMNVKKAYDSCIHFYKLNYAKDSLVQQQPDSSKNLIDIKVPVDGTTIRNMKVSPKGYDVAYVAWKNGEYKVYIQKTKDEKERSMILAGGRKDYNEPVDPDYPLLAWSNTGYKMAILYKEGKTTRLRIYNSVKARIENYIIPPKRFDRVIGMTFMEDDDKMVFSAIRNSQTDLYEFTLKRSKLKNITNDLWDDVQPMFISGASRRGILFLSNRPKPNLHVTEELNELPTGPLNVFFYDTKTQRAELLQCTKVDKGVISQPIQYGTDNFAYLYDENGIRNKYVVMFKRDRNNMDTAYSVPITNYAENILSHQYNPASNQVADVLQVGKQYKIYYKGLEIPGKNVKAAVLSPTTLSVEKPEKSAGLTELNITNGSRGTKLKKLNNEHDVEPVLKEGNVFQSEFTDTTQVAEKPIVTPEEKIAKADALKIDAEEPELGEMDKDKLPDGKDSSYVKMKSELYKLGFKPDNFSIRMDNSILFNQYQTVTDGGYTNPPLGGMITLSLNDALENHRFTGGFRLPMNFSGSTYFLQYENVTRKVDWNILYLRSANYQNVNVYFPGYEYPISELMKTTTNMIQGSANYPLDHIRSVRMSMALREDVSVFKSQDSLSYQYAPPNDKQFWSIARLEYVFDNTTNPMLNIRNGIRYKFWTEGMLQMNKGGINLYDFGADIRNYTKLYKNLIWAQRFACAHSDGKEKLLYLMGGVDNWINSQSSSTGRGDLNGFAFQTLANNMRGYKQSYLSGNTYAVMNTEVRLPVFTTFMKRPIQSSLLRYMQLVAFCDIGSAWNGLLPTNNSTNGYYFVRGSQTRSQEVSALIELPAPATMAMGYGAGLRTMLFSYFIRLDAAWNIEGAKKPIVYFSIGTDF